MREGRAKERAWAALQHDIREQVYQNALANNIGPRDAQSMAQLAVRMINERVIELRRQMEAVLTERERALAEAERRKPREVTELQVTNAVKNELARQMAGAPPVVAPAAPEIQRNNAGGAVIPMPGPGHPGYGGACP